MKPGQGLDPQGHSFRFGFDDPWSFEGPTRTAPCAA